MALIQTLQKGFKIPLYVFTKTKPMPYKID
jgi:hypothetical protein